MKSSTHSEEDDFVPELHRNVHPRERPDWEETLSAMVNRFFKKSLFVSFWRVGGKGQERIILVRNNYKLALMGLDRGPNLQLSHGSWPGIQPSDFHFEDLCPTNWTTLVWGISQFYAYVYIYFLLTWGKGIEEALLTEKFFSLFLCSFIEELSIECIICSRHCFRLCG